MSFEDADFEPHIGKVDRLERDGHVVVIEIETPDPEIYKKLPDELELVRSTVVSETDLKKLVRYEINMFDITDRYNSSYVHIESNAHYQITLEDLREAFVNIHNKKATCEEFRFGWMMPVMVTLRENVGLMEACGRDEDFNPVGDDEYIIPLNEKQMFDVILGEMISEDEGMDGCDDDDVEDHLDILGMIEYIDLFEKEKDKPIAERSFSDEDKREFISFLETNERKLEASEEEKLLYLRFIEELMAKDDYSAIAQRGYSANGGDCFYPCDWDMAKSCMERLLKLDGSRLAPALVLGNIYYYGRCNDFIPEYEKAFRYFSLAAADNIYEAEYMLGDMYRYGHYVDENGYAAKATYENVYLQAMDSVKKGEIARFPYCAFRMGEVYFWGLGDVKDPIRAYYFYLQADYAIRDILSKGGDEDDRNLAGLIAERLDETKCRIPNHVDYPVDVSDIPWQAATVLNGGNRGLITVIPLDEGRYRIVLERTRKPGESQVEYFLLTCLSTSYCALLQSLEIIATNVTELWSSNAGVALMYDNFDYDFENGKAEFYDEGQLVLRIKADKYMFFGAADPATQEDVYTLVSVRFNKDGKLYDYICPFENVSVGDNVKVDSLDGPTWVKVERVFRQSADDLPLPLERYKRVLQYADSFAQQTGIDIYDEASMKRMLREGGKNGGKE